MGLFALLFSVAMLLETFISIGMSDSLVRDVAATPAQARNLYLHALKLVVGISVVPALVLAMAAYLSDDQGAMRASLLVVAVGAPISGAFVVSQAVMQGTERVLMLTWVTFLARVLSLIWLLIAFFRGAGVEAAFVSRVMFQAASVVVFFMTLRRGVAGEPANFTMRDVLTRSLPFALNQAIREVGVRLPSLSAAGHDRAGEIRRVRQCQQGAQHARNDDVGRNRRHDAVVCKEPRGPRRGFATARELQRQVHVPRNVCRGDGDRPLRGLARRPAVRPRILRRVLAAADPGVGAGAGSGRCGAAASPARRRS